MLVCQRDRCFQGFKKSIQWIILIIIITGCSASKHISRNIEELVNGHVAPGFEKVEEEFKNNFTERGDYGAAFCVYYKGEKVVDLWGGYRDHVKKDPWRENTLAVMFSTTKGIAALCLALAHSRGYLDYDEKVATYWPEFAKNGKEDITVRQLLAHEAGLVILDDRIKIEELKDLDLVAKKIAAQEPIWEPGTKHGYHTITMGLYMNEIMRRVDPMHRSLGKFLQNEIAGPLDVEFYIGLPDTIPDERIARIKIFNPFSTNEKSKGIDKPTNFFKNRMLLKSTRPIKGAFKFKRITLEVENPSGNGVGQAEAVAKIYSEFATGGKILGIKPKTLEELSKPANCPNSNCKDMVIGFNSYFSLGFFKPGPKLYFASNRSAYGTPGAGGSFGFADPDKEIGYCYVMSKMDLYPLNDPREKILRKTVYKCIQNLEEKKLPNSN